jgi:hypothetical protein
MSADSLDFDTEFLALTGDLEVEITQATAEQAEAERRSRAPVLLGQVAQGDIIVDPAPGRRMPYWVQPQQHGAVIPLIREGNGHRLLVDTTRGGRVWWCDQIDGTDLGLLRVTEGAVVYVEQVKGLDAHDPLAVGPGVYLVGRQRTVGTPARWRPRLTDVRVLFRARPNR